jgi:hypothetical protein
VRPVFSDLHKHECAAHNTFIHDSPFHGARETIDPAMAAQAMDLLGQAYELFVEMNNRFVADKRRKGLE